MKSAYIPTTIKFRGYYAESMANGQWKLRGRGERRVISVDELQQLLNARPKKARR